MRATSIIFLVLSIILALIGVVVCGIGANLAEEQGIALFDQVADANDNLITTYNYTGDGIKKIAIEVGDCDVNFYGSSETAYIELVNFTEGSYDLSATNLTLSVVDNSNLLKLFAWGSEGINFHGFRHYLKAFDYAEKPRTINVYLTADSAVKQFDLILGKGTLQMESIRFNFDLIAEVSDGPIKLNDLLTTSDITLKSERGTITLDNVTGRSLNIVAEQGDVDLKTCYTLREIGITAGEGDVRFDSLRPSYSNYNVTLKAPAGEVSYFGQTHAGSYISTNTADDAYAFEILAPRGDITVTHTPGEGEDA